MFVAVVVSVFFVAALFLLRPAQKKATAIEAICSRTEDVRAIKVRLLHNDYLRQTDTDYQDLSAYVDLTLDLFCPCERSVMEKSRYPAVCELLIETKDGSSQKLTVVWPGNGPFLVGDDSRYCVGRIGRYFPVGKDKYVDEPAAFCGLVQSMIAKDERGTEHFAEKLRKSMGYRKPKNPGNEPPSKGNGE